MIEIVSGEPYIKDVKQLIVEYTNFLGRDLAFQALADELENIESKYLGPDGKLLVALYDKQVAGCVALRKFDGTTCEMKRLYVRPEFRSFKIGRQLVSEIIEEGRKLGYQKMLLDTIEPLTSAIALYKKFGFQERSAYYPNPMPDVVYMEMELQ